MAVEVRGRAQNEGCNLEKIGLGHSGGYRSRAQGRGSVFQNGWDCHAAKRQKGRSQLGASWQLGDLLQPMAVWLGPWIALLQGRAVCPWAIMGKAQCLDPALKPASGLLPAM